MRAIMALNEQTRARIFDPDFIEDHLKISCRKDGNPLQHVPFGEELFEHMKSVELHCDENLFILPIHVLRSPSMVIPVMWRSMKKVNESITL